MTEWFASRNPPCLYVDFRTLYADQLDYVWNTLRRLGARPSDLEDLSHEVFVTAFRRRAAFDATRPVRPWLAGIAFRVLVKSRRGQRAREAPAEELSPPDAGRSPEELAQDSELRRQLMEALEMLDDSQRTVFVMHDVDGASAPEIADALGVPLNTVYSRLRLAREALARKATR